MRATQMMATIKQMISRQHTLPAMMPPIIAQFSPGATGPGSLSSSDGASAVVVLSSTNVVVVVVVVLRGGGRVRPAEVGGVGGPGRVVLVDVDGVVAAKGVGGGVGGGVAPAGVGAGVGFGVGGGVGCGGVGRGVGAAVGGTGVGFGVGFGVGASVGFGVGAGVGFGVGFGVGAGVAGVRFGVTGNGVGAPVQVRFWHTHIATGQFCKRCCYERDSRSTEETYCEAVEFVRGHLQIAVGDCIDEFREVYDSLIAIPCSKSARKWRDGASELIFLDVAARKRCESRGEQRRN